MLRTIAQRLLFILIVSISIVFFVTWGMRLVQRSDEFRPSTTVLDTAEMAFEDSRSFFSTLLQGSLGTYETVSGPIEISEVLKQSFSASMGLMLTSALISALIGVFLGLLVASRYRPLLAFAVLLGTVIGVSIPSFFIGILLQQSVISYFTRTGTRLFSVAGFGWDYEHMLLPVIVLIARPVAYLMRTSFTVLDRAMEEDYVRTAFGKGLSHRAVVLRHTLKNVAVPVLTAIGVSWRFSLAVLPVVEYIFAWPGMGLRLLEAITSREQAVAAALSLTFGLTFLIGNLILDLLYQIVDPRLRGQT